MNNMISRLEGTATYLDEIIVVGDSEGVLQDRVIKLPERIEKYGFHIQADKCQFFLIPLKCLDSTGRCPNSNETHEIAKMSVPTDLGSLRSFLRLISYYNSFLPASHEHRGPLNQLLHKDTLWEWSPECEEAFEKLKPMLNSELLPTHYDPSLPIVLADNRLTRPVAELGQSPPTFFK
ncbi:unnamed protein product [Hymenolepis diminuta]|uniref:Retrovirus-related Pol polyprotein from transposon 17.6 n=1 Tax=Hymenolepis diminuta TaxID=6216 RepID=A0A0R3SVR3_HYMDI|nr:unnamed protein product [Hymenolepis diminuta]